MSRSRLNNSIRHSSPVNSDDESTEKEIDASDSEEEEKEEPKPQKKPSRNDSAISTSLDVTRLSISGDTGVESETDDASKFKPKRTSSPKKTVLKKDNDKLREAEARISELLEDLKKEKDKNKKLTKKNKELQTLVDEPPSPTFSTSSDDDVFERASGAVAAEVIAATPSASGVILKITAERVGTNVSGSEGDHVIPFALIKEALYKATIGKTIAQTQQALLELLPIFTTDYDDELITIMNIVENHQKEVKELNWDLTRDQRKEATGMLRSIKMPENEIVKVREMLKRGQRSVDAELLSELEKSALKIFNRLPNAAYHGSRNPKGLHGGNENEAIRDLRVLGVLNDFLENYTAEKDPAKKKELRKELGENLVEAVIYSKSNMLNANAQTKAINIICNYFNLEASDTLGVDFIKQIISVNNLQKTHYSSMVAKTMTELFDFGFNESATTKEKLDDLKELPKHIAKLVSVCFYTFDFPEWSKENIVKDIIEEILKDAPAQKSQKDQKVFGAGQGWGKFIFDRTADKTALSKEFLLEEVKRHLSDEHKIKEPDEESTKFQKMILAQEKAMKASKIPQRIK